MSKWGARLYDRAMATISRSKLQLMREKVIAKASGEVLEIGAGTGINFPLYSTELVQSVDAIEPNPHHLSRSKVKQERSKVPIYLYDAVAENLPFSNDAFDTIVCMLVFCTIADPKQAIKEIERVAKPNATVLFLEHVKVDRFFIGTAQNLFNPLWKKVAGGCHLNRNPLQLVQNSSLKVVSVKSFYKDIFQIYECVNDQ